MSLLNEFLDRLDWTHPTLAHIGKGNPHTTVRQVVRALRERPTPQLGYSMAFALKLRASASSTAVDAARKTVAETMATLAEKGHVSCIAGLYGLRPEVLILGATQDDLLKFGEYLASRHEFWGSLPHHTILGATRYMNAVWYLDECPDEALISPLAQLAMRMEKEWSSARTWGDAMLGTEGHNWYVAQFGACWTAATFFPEFKGFSKFQALYPTWFEREMKMLFREDGFSRECSVHYHVGTFDLFLNITQLAGLNGLTFSDAYHERLRLAAEIEWRLMPPDGALISFGDGHEMRPYFLQRAPSLAAMLTIPELKYLAEKLEPDRESCYGDMLLDATFYSSCGVDWRQRYDALPAREPATLDTSLPVSGYYAMRSSWERDADYAAIEASARGTLVTSHGKSAMFDLQIYAKGTPITIGNGKGPCGSTEIERTWRVGNFSHTTASVDGEDHNPLRSVYRFSQVVVPFVESWQSSREHTYFSGVHEAYERLENKVTGARRKVFFKRGEYWILIDRFTAASPEHEHLYQQHYQLAQPSTVRDDGSVVTTGDGGNLLIMQAVTTLPPSISPCPAPLDGYMNPDQLMFEQRVKGSTIFVTLLVPFVGRNPPDVSCELAPVHADDHDLPAWEVSGLAVTLSGRRDIYVDFHTHWNLPWTCGGYAGSQRLFHSACPATHAVV